MRTIRPILLAAALLVVPAAAQAAPPVPTAAPVPITDSPPVSVTVTILDGGGAPVAEHACDWAGTGPTDEDKPCLQFVGDPQAGVAAIKEAGGDRAVRRTISESRGIDITAETSRRADGTWLLRSTGTAEGKPVHLGFVCDSAGYHCRSWDAQGAPRAKKQIQYAAKRLKQA
ncbi:MAG: hypothetical protein JHC95_00170 [Solirubrobacteraceae bacterium]|nr:hypothetical protein [Solirubrobacteraceae bacterium]